MKTLAITTLLALIGAAEAQVILIDEGNKVSLTYDRKRQGSEVVEIQKWIDSRSTRTIESHFVEGALVKRKLIVTKNGVTTTNDVSVDNQGARLVTTTSTGATRTAEIPLLKKLAASDPFVTWDFAAPPNPGTVSSFMSFDPENRFWEEVTLTVEGKSKAGVSPTGLVVTRKGAGQKVRMVLDDQGMPLAWEQGRLRLVRK